VLAAAVAAAVGHAIASASLLHLQTMQLDQVAWVSSTALLLWSGLGSLLVEGWVG
jgi:hypothetical protein